jgi:hypothetical protein
MAAGFGMMASKSPFAGVAIGEGGLRGAQTYTQLGQEQRAEAMNQQKINQAADAMMLRAEQARQNLQLGYDKLSVQKQQAATQEAYRQWQERQPKTIQTIVGPRTIVDVPGKGPVDAETGEPIISPSGTPATSPASKSPPSGNPDRPYQGVPATTSTMAKARNDDLHGQAFLDAVPGTYRGRLEAVANYDAPISIFSKYGRAGLSQDNALELVRQINPQYDMYFAVGHGAAIKEFLAGGPSSPAAQITSGNTAIGHAGEAWEALQHLKNMPGFLSAVQQSNVPFLSFAAGRLQNASVRGSEEGFWLNKYLTASTLYGSEVSKFYTGNQGSQEERNTVRGPLDPALSFPELTGAWSTSTHMLGSKTTALEDRYKNAMDAPGLKEYGTKGEFKNFDVLHQSSRNVMAKIETADQAERARLGGQGAVPVAIPPPQKREINKVYENAHGKKAKWTDHGWEPIP